MHLRWFLETQDKKVKTSDTIRFVGGGALSDVTSQILADCTGRTIEVVASPQNVGSVGAAVISAVGLGRIGSIEASKKLIPAKKTFIRIPPTSPHTTRTLPSLRTSTRTTRIILRRSTADGRFNPTFCVNHIFRFRT